MTDSTSTSTSTSNAPLSVLGCLPEEIWEKHIALQLTTPDILSLLCVNKQLHTGLGHSVTFWQELSKREGNATCTTTATTSTTTHDDCWRAAKESYLLYCIKTNPTKAGGGVQWYPVRPFGNLRLLSRNTNNGIDDREGHLSCVLTRRRRSAETRKRNTGPTSTATTTTTTSPRSKEEEPQQQQQQVQATGAVERTVVITGGFSNDDSVYVIHAGTGGTDTEAANITTTRRRWNTESLQPIGTKTHFVYGASLTPLPTVYHHYQSQPQSQQQNNEEEIDEDDNKCTGGEKKKTKKTTTDNDDDDDDKKPSAPSPHPSPSRQPPIILAEMRALRFGGFRAGGYSNESGQVSMLSIKEVVVEEQPSTTSPKRSSTGTGTGGFPGQFFHRRRSLQQQEQQQQGQTITSWVAEWTDIPCTVNAGYNDHFTDVGRHDDVELKDISRAYHSATLLMDRYLVIVGGMRVTGSVMREMILDTHTWTWIIPKPEDISSSLSGLPSGRHGHSVIFDETRNRLLMFGGGSGSDLLRSGIDNSEVWELRITGDNGVNNDNWQTTGNLFDSFPWSWRKLLHGDIMDRPIDENENTCTIRPHNKLSPLEQLSLGRCHNCVKISRDTVLFLFGGGRISTNGIIAYDLKTDTFIQQKQEPIVPMETAGIATADYPIATTTTAANVVLNERRSSRLAARRVNNDNAGDDTHNAGGVYVTGILPKPKFTGVAAYLEEDGYIITHGGYCSQDHETVGTMDVLDLAPSYRRLRRQSSFNGLVIDAQRVSYAEVTNGQAQQSRRRDPEAALQTMLETVMNAPRENHEMIAREMIQQMNEGVQPSNQRSLLIMEMIANGNIPLLRENEGDDDDDDDGEEDDDDDDNNDHYEAPFVLDSEL